MVFAPQSGVPYYGIFGLSKKWVLTPMHKDSVPAVRLTTKKSSMAYQKRTEKWVLEFVVSNSHGRNPQNCKRNRKINKKIKKLMKKPNLTSWCFCMFFYFFARGEDLSRNGPLHAQYPQIAWKVVWLCSDATLHVSSIINTYLILNS